MKIVFLSNYFNHHQKELCDALNEQKGCEFNFVQTTGMREERKKLGYGMEIVPSYVLDINEDNNKEIVEKLTLEADVVIIGSAHDALIRDRLKADKLIFRYSERPLKKGIELIKYIPRFVKWNKNNPIKKQIYLLCASAYTYSDFRKFGLFKNKAYKWGYFPETKKYENIDEILTKKNPREILWCGRFIDWKHPDHLLKAAKLLADDGIEFKIKYIGCGNLEDKLKKLTADYNLDKHIEFCGSMKPHEVRLHMESSGIYVFSSDRQEGWGAVLNESMNSACAVIASDAIGSVKFLIKDKENGLIYESGNVETLYKSLKHLIGNTDIQADLGKKAYHTITDLWNARIAAERLIKLSSVILYEKKYVDLFDEGPCSFASK